MNRRQIVSIAAAALLVAALVPASASAQSFQVGAKGGINVASISWSNRIRSRRSRRGTAASLAAMSPRTARKWVWPSKCSTARRARTWTSAAPGSSTPLDLKLDYVEIPVLVRFNIPNDKTVIHIYAGPVFAFSVKDEITDTFRTTTQTTPATVETDDAGAKSSDIGIAIGAQVDVHKFLVDVRYNWGLMDIVKDPRPRRPESQEQVLQRDVRFPLQVNETCSCIRGRAPGE